MRCLLFLLLPHPKLVVFNITSRKQPSRPFLPTKTVTIPVSRFPRLLRPDPCPGTAAQIQQGSTPHIPTKAENRHLHEIVTLLSISFSIDRCVANGTHTHTYIYIYM